MLLPEQFSLNNVGIRRFAYEDAADYHEAALESVADAFQFMPWCHENYRLEEAQGWMASQVMAWDMRQGYNFIIHAVDTGKLLGAVEVASIHHGNRFGELGYWLRSSATGKGVTTTAAYLAAKFAFDHLALERLSLTTEPDNIASQRVAEKIGAIQEATLRNYAYLHGEQKDVLLYAVLKDELQSPTS